MGVRLLLRTAGVLLGIIGWCECGSVGGHIYFAKGSVSYCWRFGVVVCGRVIVVVVVVVVLHVLHGTVCGLSHSPFTENIRRLRSLHDGETRPHIKHLVAFSMVVSVALALRLWPHVLNIGHLPSYRVCDDTVCEGKLSAYRVTSALFAFILLHLIPYALVPSARVKPVTVRIVAHGDTIALVSGDLLRLSQYRMVWTPTAYADLMADNSSTFLSRFCHSFDMMKCALLLFMCLVAFFLPDDIFIIFGLTARILAVRFFNVSGGCCGIHGARREPQPPQVGENSHAGVSDCAHSQYWGGVDVYNFRTFTGPGCGLNTGLIIAVVILGVVLLVAGVFVGYASVLTATAIFAYSMYLLFTAFSVQPNTIHMSCNGLAPSVPADENGHFADVDKNLRTIINYVIVLASIIYAVVRASTGTAANAVRQKEDGSTLAAMDGAVRRHAEGTGVILRCCVIITKRLTAMMTISSVGLRRASS